MEKISALYSQYVIDGIPQDLSPGEMLDGCLAHKNWRETPQSMETLLDETTDPQPRSDNFDSWKIRDYLSLTADASGRGLPVHFAAPYTKILLERALLDALWQEGHFRLGDLGVKADWVWDMGQLGNIAAFYASAQAASEYLGNLSLKLSSYGFSEGGSCRLTLSTSVFGDEYEEEEFPVEMPYRTAHPTFLPVRKHSFALVDDPDSWLVYIPVDNCEFRLGGSLLSDLLKQGNDVAPDPTDPDYFIDCYEVLREMVEDNVVIAGATVSDGGLLTTLKRMAAAAGDKVGARIALSELMAASREQDIVRILFAEAPGVIIQIRDDDYDYLDAEFTLQDVVFYPLGHPVHGKGEIKVDASGKTGIQSILESIIRSQSSEGED
ncbi:MAG: hypothetical protein IJ654_06195 [Bacteroidales bacterium]|nr:hypothetical protein [Bacteroidales bacterium]